MLVIMRALMWEDQRDSSVQAIVFHRNRKIEASMQAGDSHIKRDRLLEIACTDVILPPQ